MREGKISMNAVTDSGADAGAATDAACATVQRSQTDSTFKHACMTGCKRGRSDNDNNLHIAEACNAKRAKGGPSNPLPLPPSPLYHPHSGCEACHGCMLCIMWHLHSTCACGSLAGMQTD